MENIKLTEDASIWISDFESDFYDYYDENGEYKETDFYDAYRFSRWKGDVYELLDNFGYEECDECSSIKHDDNQYCCTTCWGSEKVDKIEESSISYLIPKKDGKWLIKDKSNTSLRELLKEVFDEDYKYLVFHTK